MAQIVGRRHCAKSLINLIGSTADTFGGPGDKMVFENPFMELVEDVGSETGEYVAVGKVLPEWLDGTQSLSCVLCAADTLSSIRHGIKRRRLIPPNRSDRLPKSVITNNTTRASALTGAGYQALLRVIGDISSQYWEDSTNKSVCA